MNDEFFTAATAATLPARIARTEKTRRAAGSGKTQPLASAKALVA